MLWEIMNFSQYLMRAYAKINVIINYTQGFSISDKQLRLTEVISTESNCSNFEKWTHFENFKLLK